MAIFNSYFDITRGYISHPSGQITMGRMRTAEGDQSLKNAATIDHMLRDWEKSRKENRNNGRETKTYLYIYMYIYI